MSDMPHILAGLLEDKGNSESKNSQQVNHLLENALTQTAIELSMVRQEQQLWQDKLDLITKQLRKEMQEIQSELISRMAESSSQTQEQQDQEEKPPIKQSLQLIRVPSRNSSPVMQVNENDLLVRFANVDKKIKQIEWKVDRQNDQYWLQQIIKSLSKDKVFKESLVKLDESFVNQVIDQKFSEHKLGFDQRLSNTTGFLHNIASALRRMDEIIQENKQTVQMVREAVIESQKGLHQKIEKMTADKTQFDLKFTDQMTDFNFRLEELHRQITYKNPSLDSIDYKQRGEVEALKRTINTLKESHYLETAKLHDQIQKIVENMKQQNDERDRKLIKMFNETEVGQSSRFRKKASPFSMQSDKTYHIQSLREEFVVSEKRQASRQNNSEIDVQVSEMSKLVDEFGRVIKEFKKLMDPRILDSQNKSRRSAKRREFTESCEFDDRRIFSPDKNFFMAGQMIDIRKRGLSVRKHKLETYQSEVSQLSALMQLYNTPRNIEVEEMKNTKPIARKLMNNSRIRTQHQESQMFG